MFRSAIWAGRILLIAVFAICVCPAARASAPDVLARLREQAQGIQRDIDALEKSKSQLASHVSSAMLAALDSELQGKKSALATLEDKVKRAASLESDLTQLASLKSQMQSRASTQFLAAIDQEMALKQQSLKGLDGSAAAGSASPSGSAEQTANPSTPPKSDPQAATSAGKAASERSPGSASTAQAGANEQVATDAEPRSSPADAPAQTDEAKVGVCGDAPCVDQPFETRKSITGKVKPGTKKVVISVNQTIPQEVSVQADNTFSVSPDPALQQYDTVKVTITRDGTESSGTFSVKGPAVCSEQSKVLPCLNQPREGDSEVSGELAPNAKVSIKVHKVHKEEQKGQPEEEQKGQPEIIPGDGTFNTFRQTLSARLQKSDQDVEVVQTDPSGTSGPVPILPPTGPTSAQSYYALGMAGFDLTAATSTSPEQQYFAEFRLTAPFKAPYVKKHCVQQTDALESRCWVWFNPRIASVPSPSNTALNSLISTSSALSGLNNLSLSDITQSLELHGGFELALTKPRESIPFPEKEPASLSLSWIVGAGILTPFNPVTGSQKFDLAPSITDDNPGNVTGVLSQFYSKLDKNGIPLDKNGNPVTDKSGPALDQDLVNAYPQLFNTLSTACSLIPGPTPPPTMAIPNPTPPLPQAQTCKYTHVAFVPPTRSRFYRSWSTGLRLKTTFFQDHDSDNTCSNKWLSDAHRCVPADIFPGTADLTVGQDESVTGGKLRHFVFTLDANYPFPGFPWLRIFGTAHVAIERNRNIPTLILSPTPTPVPLNDASVILQHIPQPDLDYFRIGFGIDLMRAFKQLKPPGTTQTPAPSSK